MTGPRHLWSGDWRLESSAHRDELASSRARAPVLEEPEPPVASPQRRRTKTAGERVRALLAAIAVGLRGLWALLRRVPRGTRRQRRLALAMVAGFLLLAGVVYATTAALSGSSATTTAVASGSRAWLGIDVATSQLGGVMVVDVFPGSPAQTAGMEPGDVITRLNGKSIVTPSDVTSALAAMHPGQRIEIQFEGSGVSYASSVALATRPAGYP